MLEKIMMDGEPLEVGDEVYCLANGWVKLLGARRNNGLFPYLFTDKNGETHTYTKDFKYRDDVGRTLYWQKPEIIPPPKPKKKVKVWDWFIKSGTCLGHHTNESEDDMKRWYPNDLIQKIDGTEREVIE